MIMMIMMIMIIIIHFKWQTCFRLDGISSFNTFKEWTWMLPLIRDCEVIHYIVLIAYIGKITLVSSKCSMVISFSSIFPSRKLHKIQTPSFINTSKIQQLNTRTPRHVTLKVMWAFFLPWWKQLMRMCMCTRTHTSVLHTSFNRAIRT